MYCIRCGIKLKDDANFCPICGARAERSSAPPPSEPAPASTGQPPSKPKRWILPVILTALVLSAGIIAAVFFLGRASEETADSTVSPPFSSDPSGDAVTLVLQQAQSAVNLGDLETAWQLIQDGYRQTGDSRLETVTLYGQPSPWLWYLLIHQGPDSLSGLRYTFFQDRILADLSEITSTYICFLLDDHGRITSHLVLDSDLSPFYSLLPDYVYFSLEEDVFSQKLSLFQYERDENGLVSEMRFSGQMGEGCLVLAYDESGCCQTIALKESYAVSDAMSLFYDEAGRVSLLSCSSVEDDWVFSYSDHSLSIDMGETTYRSMLDDAFRPMQERISGASGDITKRMFTFEDGLLTGQEFSQSPFSTSTSYTYTADGILSGCDLFLFYGPNSGGDSISLSAMYDASGQMSSLSYEDGTYSREITLIYTDEKPQQASVRTYGDSSMTSGANVSITYFYDDQNRCTGYSRLYSDTGDSTSYTYRYDADGHIIGQEAEGTPAGSGTAAPAEGEIFRGIMGVSFTVPDGFVILENEAAALGLHNYSFYNASLDMSFSVMEATQFAFDDSFYEDQYDIWMAGENVTYHYYTDSFFVVSGYYGNGNIYYNKLITTGGFFYQVYLTYPQETRTSCDAVLQQILDSLSY